MKESDETRHAQGGQSGNSKTQTNSGKSSTQKTDTKKKSTSGKSSK